MSSTRQSNSVKKILIVAMSSNTICGVDLEIEKWSNIYKYLGFTIKKCVGITGFLTQNSTEVYLIPGLWMNTHQRSCDSIAKSFKRVLKEYSPDIVHVEQLFGTPSNPEATEALHSILVKFQLPVICHIHETVYSGIYTGGYDTTWASQHLPPRDLSQAIYACTNTLDRNAFTNLGLNAIHVPNRFDFNLNNSTNKLAKILREMLNLKDSFVIFQPTRLSSAKNLEITIELANLISKKILKKGVVINTDYLNNDLRKKCLMRRMKKKAQEKSVRLITRQDIMINKDVINECYSISDLISFPCWNEGFGNPVIESVIHKKLLYCWNYPVLEKDILPKGFYFVVDKKNRPSQLAVDTIIELFSNADVKEKIIQRNYEIGLQHYDIQKQKDIISDITVRLGQT